jgi:hypothetical protein
LLQDKSVYRLDEKMKASLMPIKIKYFKLLIYMSYIKFNDSEKPMGGEGYSCNETFECFIASVKQMKHGCFPDG